MKHIIKILDETPYHSHAFDLYFKSLHLAVFDIETTGLRSDRDRIILIGCVEIKDNHLVAHQYFAEDFSEEVNIIEAFLHDFADTDVLITYNGASFDMPFLYNRMKILGIPNKDSDFYNFDLYRILRCYSPIKKFMPNLKQKTVESFMGLWSERTDEISGAESVSLYHNYIAKRKTTTLKKILLHNSDDISLLQRLLKILDRCDVHKAMHEIGFPLIYKKNSGLVPRMITTDNIKIIPACVEVSGKQYYNGIGRMMFESEGTPYNLTMDANELVFQLSVPLLDHDRKKEFYIADLELLGLDTKEFENYPQAGDGLLILKQNGKTNYLQTNHFIKALLDHILADF